MAIIDTYGGEVITDEAGLRKWGEEKAFIIGARMGSQTWYGNPTYTDTRNMFFNQFRTDFNSYSTIPVTFRKPDLLGTGYGDLPSQPLSIYKSFQAYNKTARMCGYVMGHNTDGSYRIKVYGNQTLNAGKNFQRTYRYFLRKSYVPVSYEPFPTSLCKFGDATPYYGFSGDQYFGAFTSSDTNSENRITEANANNVISDGFVNGYSNNFLYFHGKYWGRNFGDIFDNGSPTQGIILTTSSDQTLELGDPITNAYYSPFSDMMPEYWAGRLEENIDGNLYLYMYNSLMNIAVANKWLVEYSIFGDNTYLQFSAGGTSTVQGEYCHMWKPYNLILTENEAQARQYVLDGTLPDDAILFPFDEDNLGYTDGSDDSGGGGSSDTGEDGKATKEFIDTPTTKPDVTPVMASNNNYYWMQINELKAFMDWFWNNAGDLADADDLWQAIQGLYANLGEAILRVRYMPVQVANLGEVEAVTQVNVGQLAHIMNTNAFKKSVGAPVVTLGTVSIPLSSDEGFFTDFAPYCNITIYLPLYGFMDLDANMLMGGKLRVQCAYDMITGTIQYFIQASDDSGNYMTINTVTAKCNVDIPITLQSKAESDGAIMSNIGRIGQALTSVAVAPASAIGTTLGLAGFQADAKSPPLAMRGGMGETGAFYSYPEVYVVIKKPAYVKPHNYDSRVGYPCNGAYVLEKIHGYTECFNPYIEFTHMTVNDSDINPPKPTADEIETIYNALTDGVILP